MKKRYQCDFCELLFDNKNECVEHELDCPSNPATKSCDTCKSQTKDIGGTNKLYYGCKKNIIETSPKAYKKNCESWEYDEGYAHT